MIYIIDEVQGGIYFHRKYYDVVGTVRDQYIVKTDKGLKRVKIKASDNKRIGDQIKIEKL